MISLIALIFCSVMLVFTLTIVAQRPTPLNFGYIVVQTVFVLINVPGTVWYLQTL